MGLLGMCNKFVFFLLGCSSRIMSHIVASSVLWLVLYFLVSVNVYSDIHISSAKCRGESCCKMAVILFLNVSCMRSDDLKTAQMFGLINDCFIFFNFQPFSSCPDGPITLYKLEPFRSVDFYCSNIDNQLDATITAY